MINTVLEERSKAKLSMETVENYNTQVESFLNRWRYKNVLKNFTKLQIDNNATKKWLLFLTSLYI